MRIREEDTFLEVFEGGLIQSKLPRQGPIRDPSTALEHREHLVEDLLKGHPCSFAASSLRISFHEDTVVRLMAPQSDEGSDRRSSCRWRTRRRSLSPGVVWCHAMFWPVSCAAHPGLSDVPHASPAHGLRLILRASVRG